MENEAATHEATVDEVGPCKKKLRITVPGDKVQEEIDKQYGEIIQNHQFPGFRKGRVPRRLVEKRFGEQILDDVKQTLVSETFEKTLEDHSLSPLGDPEIEYEGIEIKPGESLAFEVTVEVKPTFDLPDYKGIEVDRDAVEVPDKDVEEALDRFARSRGTYEPSRAKQIKPDDLVVADTAVVQGDTTVLEQENDQFIPEQGRLFGLKVDGLADTLKSTGLDETAEVAIEITDALARGELSAGPATVRITPRELKRLKVPKVDEKLAEALDFDSVDELRDNVRKQLAQDGERAADRAVEEKILAKVLEETSFELPEGIVEKELENILERERIRLQLDGTAESDVESKLETARTEAQEEIRTRLKKAFLLEKIAAKEKIFVTEEMMRDTLAGMAARQGKSLEDMIEWFESRNQLGELRSELRERMTREALRKAAKITDKKGK